MPVIVPQLKNAQPLAGIKWDRGFCRDLIHAFRACEESCGAQLCRVRVGPLRSFVALLSHLASKKLIRGKWVPRTKHELAKVLKSWVDQNCGSMPGSEGIGLDASGVNSSLIGIAQPLAGSTKENELCEELVRSLRAFDAIKGSHLFDVGVLRLASFLNSNFGQFSDAETERQQHCGFQLELESLLKVIVSFGNEHLRSLPRPELMRYSRRILGIPVRIDGSNVYRSVRDVRADCLYRQSQLLNFVYEAGRCWEI